MRKSHKDYVALLGRYLASNKDALLWVIAYSIYVHSIDDVIDNEIPEDKETRQFLLSTFEFAEVIYTNIFYLQHIHILRPLVKMASNTYMDSVELERSKEPWKIACADELRHSANEVILAVIEIVSGITSRREASLEIREISVAMHHKEDGTIC